MIVFFYVLVAFTSVMLIRHVGEADSEFGEDGEGRNPFAVSND